MANDLKFDDLRKRYVTFPPLHFRDSPDNLNTCAVRLSDAVTRVVPDFFSGSDLDTWVEKVPTGRYVSQGFPNPAVKFEPAPPSRRLPVNAGQVAMFLKRRLGPLQLASLGPNC